MLASFLPPKKRRCRVDHSPFSPLYSIRDPLLPGEPRGHRTDFVAGNSPRQVESGDNEDGHVDNGEHVDPESAPLLPIFAASYLDTLPVYNVTHAIRLLIVSRCETTLSWDQLRSPQVSQFLVKPIQQAIMAAHFSHATLYALMTNCLQFNKEVELDPGNSGASQSRAMVSELLAIKLLKEYAARDLTDALSFEFYPLQGQRQQTTSSANNVSDRSNPLASGAGRISCFEVAIRAQAKRFLAHPVVVQQLEAIWDGTIVFYSAADSLHRSPGYVHRLGAPAFRTPYGTNDNSFPQFDASEPGISILRRLATRYDPRDASLFKLSRLRVPRYRQVLSTLSFAVLLGLFLAVLQQRRLEITSLEIIFWLWSAGFMLDEVVGFNEQGFSLYLMSFWNLFDLGILLLLFCYYCMRIYGAVMPNKDKHAIADQAYDILSATAVFLFPRLFSVLDHYRYFSQLIIAFRIMASDLVAVFVLIVIACSGFFVSFTLSFGNNHSPASIAFSLFQIVMGFTPAAWSFWDEYNLLGRVILTLFLFICHFLVVTMLITVLTNSFTRIVQNSNQEHQFLFAVNTISMVKSDALFSYVAPTNILAWLIIPLRYLMPFRQFIRLNRSIIKITHLPILFAIYLYEKTILCSRVAWCADSDPLTRARTATRAPAPGRRRFHTFGSTAPRLVREPSVATYQKDRALDEVFRPSFDDRTPRTMGKETRRPPDSSAVNNWMQAMGQSPANPPVEQDSDEVDQLERLPRYSRFPRKRPLTSGLRDFTETTHSVASNPEEAVGHVASQSTIYRRQGDLPPPGKARRLSRHTDIEGDDELTSEDDNNSTEDEGSPAAQPDGSGSNMTSENREKTPPMFYSSRPSTARLKSQKASPASPKRPKLHSRNVSDVTMLYKPVNPAGQRETGISATPIRSKTQSHDQAMEAALSTSADFSSFHAGRIHDPIRPRSNPLSVPELGNFALSRPQTQGRRRSSDPFELGSDLSGIKAMAGGFLAPAPSSFTTQMAYAMGGMRRADSASDSQGMLSKLVLARMNNIEEGFREVIKEVKDLRRSGPSRSQSRLDELRGAPQRRRRVERKETKVIRNQDSSEGPSRDENKD